MKRIESAFRLCGVLLATGACHAHAQIRYEFDITVVENTAASLGVGGDLADLELGTSGEFYFLVHPASPMPNFNPNNSLSFFRVLDTGVHVGGVSSGAAPGVYPSALTRDFFNVLDDSVSNSGNDGPSMSDSLLFSPMFASPEIDGSGFHVTQRLFDGQAPTLLADSNFPLELDLGLATSRSFTLSSSLGDGAGVRFSIDGVRIVIVPAPASAALLACVGCVAFRRRR